MYIKQVLSCSFPSKHTDLSAITAAESRLGPTQKHSVRRMNDPEKSSRRWRRSGCLTRKLQLINCRVQTAIIQQETKRVPEFSSRF